MIFNSQRPWLKIYPELHSEQLKANEQTAHDGSSHKGTHTMLFEVRLRFSSYVGSQNLHWVPSAG